jgi:hypothetical protein
MKLKELAELMGKSEFEVKSILQSNDIIELKLMEKNIYEKKDNLTINMVE